MFFAHLMLVVSVVLAVSLLVAEIVFSTPAERRLGVPVRVGLAYSLMLAYFAAAFRLLAIEWVWLLGIVLFAAYAATRPAGFWPELRGRLRAGWRQYLFTYLGFLALANVFLLPLHLGGTYGPFTEGGGDVSIYADGAKYSVDNHLPVWGPQAAVASIRRMTDLSRLDFKPGGKMLPSTESTIVHDITMANPPTAESAFYNVSVQQTYSAAQFSPTATWFLFFDNTSYPVFYGVLAFQYAAMILAVVGLLWRFGWLPALLGLLAVSASHGLASVLYNVYYIQTTCLMLCALMIAALSEIRIFSRVGLRVFWPAGIIIASTYSHFLAVLLPLFAFGFVELLPKWRWLGPLMRPLRPAPVEAAAADSTSARAPRRHHLLVQGLTGLLIVLVSFWLVTEIPIQIDLMGQLLAVPLERLLPLFGLAPPSASTVASAFVIDYSTYFGKPVPLVSETWLSFLLGVLSQQHRPPFMTLPESIEQAVSLTLWFGVALLGLGLLAWPALAIEAWRRRGAAGRAAQEPGQAAAPSALAIGAALYVLTLGTIAVHALITQGSMYTQAKGTQNILVVVYTCILLLPFGLLYAQRAPSLPVRLMTATYGCLLIGFTGALLVPRVYLAWQLGHAQDRATVIGQRYYQEAARVRQADAAPFVLVEPRRSSDVYMLAQPFFGARMITTRYLGLGKIFFTDPVVTERPSQIAVEPGFAASDFVNESDVPNLWIMSAGERRADVGARADAQDQWVARRLTDLNTPTLLLFGDDYGKDVTARVRADGSSDQGRFGQFSYTRNGAAVLVLPADAADAHTVSVRLQPTRAENLPALTTQVKQWLDRTAPAEVVRYNAGAGGVSIEYRVPSTATLRWLPLARYRGEMYVNVRVDGREMTDTNVRVTPDRDTITVGETQRVRWDGVERTAPDDWIGLFPIKDVVEESAESRAAFVHTGGASSGEIQVRVPSGLEPGAYEWRFYRAGTWNLLGISPAVTVKPSEARITVAERSLRVGGQVAATWAGLAAPTNDDWIGLFPVGGKPETRVIFTGTSGSPAGRLTFRLPPDVAPGQYELRLLTGGDPSALAISQPLAVMPSQSQLTVSTSASTAGARVTATWSGLPNPTPGDWVGLFPVGGDTRTRIAALDTGGKPDGQAELRLPGTIPPGRYELQLFAGDGRAPLATSAPLAVREAQSRVNLVTPYVSPGMGLRIAWTDVPDPSPKDWVGIFPLGGGEPTRVTFKDTGGQAKGEMQLKLPGNVAHGQYEARLFADGTWSLLATSTPLTVGESQSRLTVLTPNVLPGTSLEVAWANVEEPTPTDWIGVFPAGGGDTTRIAYQHTGGGANGSLELLLPESIAPGRYETRLFTSDSWDTLTRTEFQVASPGTAPSGVARTGRESQSRVAVLTPEAAPGASLRIAWANVSNPTPTDWIGVFPAGGGDATRIAYQHTGGGADGSLELPLPESIAPGRYEVRLFANDSWDTLATTELQVTAGTASSAPSR